MDNPGIRRPSVSMNKIAARLPSASAPFIPQTGPSTPEERIRRALELGRRGQLLRKLYQQSIEPDETADPD